MDPYLFFVTLRALRFLRGENKTFYEAVNVDDLVKSRKVSFSVIPAKAGIQCFWTFMDSRLRGSDEDFDFLRMHQCSKLKSFEMQMDTGKSPQC